MEIDLYIVRWCDANSINKGFVTGTMDSILSFTQILESAGIEFKVYTTGFCLEPNSFGVGGYRFWLTEKESFGQGAR